jgi:hypothetical protein
LVYFRQRLIEHGKAEVAMRAVLAALQKEGLIPKGSKQRLDSTHVLGAVARLSALECVREMPANKSGAIAPRLSNNDPCTSNCGKLILDLRAYQTLPGSDDHNFSKSWFFSRIKLWRYLVRGTDRALPCLSSLGTA